MSDRKVRDLLAELDRLAVVSRAPGIMSLPVRDMAENLRRAVDAPDTPTIIRTVEELEALDPATELLGPGLSPRTASSAQSVCHWWGADEVLPAVVVRDGADVRADIRAARKALEKETE